MTPRTPPRLDGRALHHTGSELPEEKERLGPEPIDQGEQFTGGRRRRRGIAGKIQDGLVKLKEHAQQDRELQQVPEIAPHPCVNDEELHSEGADITFDAHGPSGRIY